MYQVKNILLDVLLTVVRSNVFEKCIVLYDTGPFCVNSMLRHRAVMCERVLMVLLEQREPNSAVFMQNISTEFHHNWLVQNKTSSANIIQ